MKYRTSIILLILLATPLLLYLLGSVAALPQASSPPTSAQGSGVDLNGPENPGVNFTAVFTENMSATAVVDPATLTITNADSIFLQSAAITLTNDLDGSHERLQVDTSGTQINSHYDSQTGVLTLVAIGGQQPLSQFEQALRTTSYTNSSENPNATLRTIAFMVDGNITGSQAAAAEVTIVPVNDTPMLDARGSMTLPTLTEDAPINEGSSVEEIVVSAGGDRITDLDGPYEGIAITAADNSNGRWQYKTAINWLDIGNVAPQTAVLLTPDTRVRFLPKANYNGPATFGFCAWDQSDGRENTSSGVDTTGSQNNSPFSRDSETVVVNVVPTNDAPFIDLNGPAVGTKYQAIFVEDGGTTSIVDAALTVQDVDNTTLTEATVTLTNYPDGNLESLATAVAVPPLVVTYNPNDGRLKLTGPATIAQFEQTLRSVVYNNLSQNPDGADRIVEFVASDGITQSNTAVSTIAINRVNDAPVLNATTPVLLTDLDEDNFNSVGNIVENIVATGGPDPITDADNDGFEGVALIAVDSSNGQWQYKLDGATSWVDLTAVSSISATLLGPNERIRLVPASNYNGPATFSFRAWDRSDNRPIGSVNVNTNINGGTTAFSTNQAIATINVNAINDTSVLDLNGAAAGRDFTADFAEGVGPVQIVSPTLSLTDVDDNNIQSARIVITNLLDGSQEKLNANLQDTGITLNPNTNVGELLLTGSSSIENYQAVLRTITYDNLSLMPTDSENRLIRFEVTDQSGGVSEPVTSTVRINPVNHLPIVNSFTVTTTEDITFNFSLALFAAHFADPDGDSLTEIKIDSLPQHGVLLLNQTAVTPGATISANQISSLAYIAQKDWYGSTSFQWNGKDSEVYPAEGGVVTMLLLPVNDPPVLSNITKQGDEDVAVNFAAADFVDHFADVDGDSLVQIRIRTLPGGGLLKLNGQLVNIDDIIPQNQLANLRFEPNQDVHNTVSFDWNASDGSLWATADAKVQITLTAVNDPPQLNPITKFGSEDNSISFTKQDFVAGFTDIDGDLLQKIEIVTLPNNGQLKFQGVLVTIGQEIAANNLAGLTFSPAANWYGDTSFQWNGYDGAVYAISPALGNIMVTPVNDLPVLDLNGIKTGKDYMAAFWPNGTAVAIASPDFILTDVDNETLQAITIQQITRPDGIAEQLFVNTEGTSISPAYENGIMQLTGPDAVENFREVVRTLTYNNANPDPTNDERLIQFTVNDGEHTSEPVYTYIVPPFATFLPIAANKHRLTDEPNNNCQQAFPIILNQQYGFFAQDREDWYSFEIPGNSATTVELTNFAPQGNGQLIIYTGSCPSGLISIGQNGDASPTKTISLGSRPPGRYYIRVFNSGSPNATQKYNLHVRY